MIKKTALALLLSSISVLPAFAGQVLAAETQLAKGEYLSTRSGLFSVVVQADGNVVKYYTPPNYAAKCSGDLNGCWRTGTTNGNHLRMQMDGNLALYTSSNTWAWTSGTGGKPYNMGYKLVLKETGNLVIMDASNNIVKDLSGIDQNTYGTRNLPAYFPFRKYVNGVCQEGLTPPLSAGADAQYWAQNNGGTVGFCNSPY